MEHTFVLVMVALTSLATYIFGVKGLRLHSLSLRRGLGNTCEVVGLTLIFCIANLSVGIIIVFAARLSMGRFVSLYHLSDITLLALSLLQALAFQSWQASARHHSDVDG